MKNKFNWLNPLLNFFAVILGVYLAFYINERAKEKQDRKESELLMQSMVNELSGDLKSYEEYQIPFNKQQGESVDNLIQSLLADSLEDKGDLLSEVFQVQNFAPFSSTYSSMKSSGKLELIEDLELRKTLTDYYEGLVLESISKGKFQSDYFTNELLTWFTNNVDILEMKILNKEELLVLRNKLIIYGSLIGQKVESYEEVVKSSKKLKLQIETLLEPK